MTDQGATPGPQLPLREIINVKSTLSGMRPSFEVY
jgi:hypothetical protein